MTVYPPPAPPYLGPAKYQGDSTNKPINRIVMHGTVSPCVSGGARTIARYFRTTVRRPSSAHYVIDPGEVVQVVYDSVVAFGAPPNEHSLHVELCDPVNYDMARWDDDNHDAMLRRAAKFVAELCLAYDVPIRWVSAAELRAGEHGITDHDEVSKAWHQTTHWDLGAWPKARFIRLVRREADRLRALAAEKPTTPSVDPTTQPPATPTPVPGPSTPPAAESTGWTEAEHNLFRKLSLEEMKSDLRRTQRADLRGFCEGSGPTARRALIEHARESGHKLFHPNDCELAAIWNPAVFDEVPGKSGVALLHGSGPKGPNPERYLLWVGLVHKATRKRLLRFVVHAAQGALKPDDQTNWGPVQERWRDWAITQYWLGVVARTAAEMKSEQWDAIVLGGDFNGRLQNHDEWFYPGPLLDGLYRADVSKGIDRIVWTRDSKARQVRRWETRHGVHSDHPMQFAEFKWEAS